MNEINPKTNKIKLKLLTSPNNSYYHRCIIIFTANKQESRNKILLILQRACNKQTNTEICSK